MTFSKQQKINIFLRIIPILILSFLFLTNSSLAGYKVEMALPGAPAEISDPGKYITYLFNFSFYLIGFLAVAMITYGGVLYMIPNKIAEAKERIWGAVIGLVFLLCSFLILKTIDPELLKLTPDALTKYKAGEAPALDAGRTGISETDTTMSIYFDSTAEAYNTREKCEAIGRASYGDRLIGVIFSAVNCTIVVTRAS